MVPGLELGNPHEVCYRCTPWPHTNTQAWAPCLAMVAAVQRGHRATSADWLHDLFFWGGVSQQASSKPAASRGATRGPEFSILSATTRTAPKFGRWAPLRSTIKRRCFWAATSPSALVRGHLTAQNGPICRGRKWTKIGQNRPKMTQNGPCPICGPC